MSEGQVVFPKAPVELVAVEVRFRNSARLRQPETLDKLQLALEDLLPIRRDEQMAAVPLGGQMVNQPYEQVVLFIDQNETMSAAIRSTALTVETTLYKDFIPFRDAVLHCAGALAELQVVPAVERVGLRFVDEIRVKEPIEDAGSWERWLSGDLLAARSIGEPHRLSMLQGTMQFETGEDTNLVVRYAMLTGPGVVQPASLRPLETAPPGPFFVIDIDSYWQPLPDRRHEFDPEFIAMQLDKLFPPVEEAFRRGAITNRRRNVPGEQS